MDKKYAENISKLLEVYLFEYCEVNGIKESALKRELHIWHDRQKRLLEVRTIEGNKIKMSAKYRLTRKGLKVTLSGEPVNEEGNYPKTLDFLKTIN